MNVATVTTTLEFQTRGAQEAIRYTQQIAAAQEAVQRAAGNTSAEVQKLSNDLQAATARLLDFAAAPARIAQEAQALGSTMQSLSGDVAKVTAAADQQQANLDALTRTYAQLAGELATVDARLNTTKFATPEWRELNVLAGELTQKMAALTREMEVEAAATAKLRAEQQALVNVQKKATDLPVQETAAAANVEKLTTRLMRLVGATGDASTASANFTRTLSTGLVTAVQSGSIGASVLGQALQFLASKAGVLAVVLGAVTIKLVQMSAQMIQVADMMNGLRASTQASVDSLSDLEGISLAALAQSIGEVTNRMESFGGNTAAAEELVRIGTALSFLDDRADNAVDGIRAVEQALSGSVEGLRAFGLPVEQLKQLQEEAKRSGRDVRGLTAEWIAAQMAMREGLVSDQMENEQRTLAGVRREIGEIVAQAANTDAMKIAIQELADALRNLLPIIKFIADGISGFVSDIIFSFSNLGADFKGELAALEIMVLRTRANIQFWASDSEKRAWREEADAIEAEAQAAMKFGDAAGDAAKQTADWGKEMARTTERINQGEAKLRSYTSAVSSGFSLVGGIRNLAQALTDLSDGATRPESFAYVQEMWSNLEGILERGTEATMRQFRAVRDAVQEMFSSGLISEREFNRMVEVLQLTEAAADPLIEQAKKIEAEHGKVESAAGRAGASMQNNLIPSVNNTTTAFNEATTAITNTANALASIDGTTVTVGVNVVQGGATISGPISAVGNRWSRGIERFMPPGPGLTPGSIIPKVVTPPKGTSAAGRLGGGSFIDEPGSRTAAAAAQKATREKEAADALTKLGNWFDQKPRGGGGGGGGGAKSLAASIEDIRNLMDEVNRAIRIGARGGIGIGLGGNAIPLLRDTVLNSGEGGELSIGTLNIRGIWDFSDPTARRLIIKELEEALRDLRRER